MKRIILAFLLTISCFHASAQALEVYEFIKFNYKNWYWGGTNREYCQFFYYSIIVKTDQDGMITSWEYNNPVPVEVQRNLDYLKKFQFPEKYNLKNSSILYYITVDQMVPCRKATAHIQQSTEVMTEVLKNMASAINTNPKIKIMYQPIALKYYPVIQCFSLPAVKVVPLKPYIIK